MASKYVIINYPNNFPALKLLEPFIITITYRFDSQFSERDLCDEDAKQLFLKTSLINTHLKKS